MNAEHEVVWTGATWREYRQVRTPPPIVQALPFSDADAKRAVLILRCLKRHPKTTMQLAGGLGMSRHVVRSALRNLYRMGSIRQVGAVQSRQGPPRIVWGIKR